MPVRYAAADYARTDAEGAFRLENLPLGAARVTVDHEEHAAWVSEPLELHSGENPPLQVLLSIGGTIRVTVQDESGAPVEAANVVAVETASQASANAQTDATGLALLEHLRPGNWQVLRMAMEDPRQLETMDLEMQFHYVELAEGEVVELKIGGPTPVATVEGRIMAGGMPVAGKTLILMDGGGMKTASTDEQGKYQLKKVRLGNHVLMLSSGFGGGAIWTGAVRVSEAGTQQHDIELPNSTVEVLVVDGASGQPLAGIPVNLRPADETSLSGGSFLKTDAQGLARYEMLAPGSYLAAIGNVAMPMLGGGEGLGSTLLSGIEVPDGGTSALRYEARLPAPATLRLRVAGPDGNFIAGAHVFCTDENGHPLNVMSMKGTNAKGVVELAGLPSGDVHIVVRHPQLGRAEFDLALTAGAVTKHEVRLDAGVHLLVSVVGDDGSPLPGVFVVVYDGRGRAVNYFFTMEDSQAIQQSWFSGQAQKIGPLMPGDYVVALNRPGAASQRHAVTVTAAPAEQPLRLRFSQE